MIPFWFQQAQTSNIFGYADETDRASGISSGASTPRRKMSTSSQERLFGIYPNISFYYFTLILEQFTMKKDIEIDSIDQSCRFNDKLSFTWE